MKKSSYQKIVKTVLFTMVVIAFIANTSVLGVHAQDETGMTPTDASLITEAPTKIATEIPTISSTEEPTIEPSTEPTIANESPKIISLEPKMVDVGSQGFTLTINGSNFSQESIVMWNGESRDTLYINESQIVATILTTDLSTPGTVVVTVTSGEINGEGSNEVTFTINYLTPIITSISPNSKTIGESDFVLSIVGSNFAEGATVNWNGSPRTATFINESELTAAIPSSDLLAAGKAEISVVNPNPTNGISNVFDFSITSNLIEVPQVGNSNEYENDDFGLQFILPDTWAKQDMVDTGRSLYQEFDGVNAKLALVIYDFDAEEYSSLQDLVNSSIDEGVSNVEVISNKAKVINGLEGIETITKVDGEYFITEYFLRNNYVFVFNFLGLSSPEYTDEIFMILENMKWSDISNTDKISKLPSFSEPVEEISAAAAPTLKFPFRGTYKISNGYYNDPSGVGHANGTYDKYALDFIDTTGTTLGDPVYAAFAGVVYGLPYEASGCGNFVKLKYSSNNVYTTYYCHLSSFNVSLNQTVTQGYVLGFAGSTGNSTGPHIHFAYLYNAVSILPEPMSGYTGFKYNNTYTFLDSTATCPTTTSTVAYVCTPKLTPAFTDSCSTYWYPFSGFNGNTAYLTENAYSSTTSSNSGTWTPNLPQSGTYKVEVYIAHHEAYNVTCSWGTATLNADTSKAKYKIYSANGTSTVTANQLPYDNEWVNLGQFTFNAGTSGYVTLSDLTGETRLSTNVSFSAMRFTLVSTPNNPAPTISSISPTLKNAGDSAFTLTVNGTNFVSGSIVRWNDSDRATSYVNSTQLTVTIPSADVAAGGIANVTVYSPTPGGGTSNSISFPINNPIPTVSSLLPTSVVFGGTSFSVTVIGTNFNSSSIVRWNGSDRTTAYVNGTHLTATITASDIATAGTASITVYNPAPSGGTSDSVDFAIENPVPTLISVSPSSKLLGEQEFTLTLTGTNFLLGSVVRWDNMDLSTTYVSTTQLTATIPATFLASAGTVSIIVYNPAPGGGLTSTVSFTIKNPSPTVVSLSQNSITAGGTAFELTVNGSNFLDSSVVRWNGSDRTTTFVTSNQLKATISTADIAFAGTFPITVNNPTPGGGSSTALVFTVNPVTEYPAIPVLSKPLNGTSLNSRTPVFSVSTVTGAKQYEYQVSEEGDFSTVQIDQVTSTTSFTVSSSQRLEYGRVYYWRSRAINSLGNFSDWSESRSFTVTILTSPSNGSYTTNMKPKFSWAAVTGAYAYELQVSTSLDFSDLLVDRTQLSPNYYTLSTALPNKGIYYWQVRVFTDSGWSEYMPAWKLILTETLPSAPALSAPISGYITNDVTPTFTWNTVANAIKYRVQIDTVTSFLHPVQDLTLSEGQFIFTVSELPEGKYYWRVAGINRFELKGAWSSYRLFTIDTTKPLAPVLYSPTNQKANRGTPKYSWLSSSGAKFYQYQYGADSSCTVPIFTSVELSSTSITPPLQDVGTYFWCVRAKDIAGNWSNWSTARKITILPLVPSAPMLISPVSGFITNNVTPTLSWKPVSYGYLYEVQVSKLSNYSTLVQDEILDPSVLTFDATTNGDGKYYWRVRAINKIGERGSWSSSRYFTVDTIAPAAPAIVAPLNGATVTTTIPKLTASTQTGAKYYRFQVSQDELFGTKLVDATKTTYYYTLPSSQALPIGILYWRIQAIDVAGNASAWSSTHSFIVNLLKSPTNHLFTTTIKPTFYWAAASGALQYEIQIDNAETFTSTGLIDAIRTTANYSPATSFAYGTYYWRVRVNTTTGWGNWTPTWSFTIYK